MARNRKSQSAAVRFAPAFKALVLCLFIGGSGVGYVWYKSQIDMLGRQVKERETRFAELQRKNKMARAQLDSLTSPIALDARVKDLNKKLNLGLAAPPVSQIVRLVETPAEPPAVEPRRTQNDFRQAQANPRNRGN
ncbi:MAG: hypothetical protein ABIQ35_08735 [Verrucomicrobiota bacterium]